MTKLFSSAPNRETLIGGWCRTNRDKCTPYWRWTDEATGGVEITLASFLNLVNGDWLRRPALDGGV